jgi:hypothetical protein
MKNKLLHIIMLVAFNLLLSDNSMAQRVSFGTYTTDDIVLTPLNSGELNFNLKQTVIVAGQTVTIPLSSDAAAVLTIVGRADLDVTVTIDAPLTLDLDVDNKIDLALSFAYSNFGKSNETDAKTSAVQVPSGFTSVTFPMLKRASGLPPPPPIPGHTGYSAPTATAYLFIYGTLGPVPANAAIGIYRGDINVRVEYSKY